MENRQHCITNLAFIPRDCDIAPNKNLAFVPKQTILEPPLHEQFNHATVGIR